MDVKLSEHEKILNEYKYRLRKAKEKNWRQFVNVYSNLDSWDVIYRMCRGRNVRECLTSLNVNGVEYAS